MAWAFVTGGQSQAQLFMVLAATAERRIGDFTVQELANMVCAFVTFGQSEVQLFMMLAGIVK